jgi:hypothetical protein
MSAENNNVRTERIDAAVSAASELLGALIEGGAVTPTQAKLVIEAAVRAAVPNPQEFEIRESAKRIAADLEGITKK